MALIATHARHRHRRPEMVPKTPGNRREHLISGRMPQGIVDILEHVEIKQQDRKMRPRTPGAFQRPLAVPEERLPARQPGQRIRLLSRLG